MKSRKRTLQVSDLVVIGMLAAMCAIATLFKIPFGSGAMIHLGTGAMFTVAILFGGVYAGLAGAIGSAFFDLIFGFSIYTFWSFVIKGAAGYIAGTVARGRWPETVVGPRWLPKAVLGMVLAALWSLGGYFVAWWSVLGSMSAATANIPGSLLTSGVGIAMALLLAPKLRGVLRRM